MIRILVSRRMVEPRVTQTELAEAAGIRSDTINDLYHNAAKQVDPEQPDKICEALQCDLTEIIIFL